MLFLSTPSARRATHQPTADDFNGVLISIHALREEGDVSSDGQLTRPPIFLSTPSARRATRCWTPSASDRTYFYPRPPRGGRHSLDVTLSDGVVISIHALREEGDD